MATRSPSGAASRMRVRFLGTGGAANEARHQAALLVEWGEGAERGRILLDTAGGLDIVRLLIAAGCQPAEVRDIFVSHQHTDHVGGLEPLLLWSIIRALRKQGRPPGDETRVYADGRVLADIEQLFAATITAAPRLFGDKLQRVESADGASVALRGGARLTTFLVDHEPAGAGARGCVVEHNGTRLVYSGDTRPTDRLIEAARGADMLIHEAGGLDAHAAETHRLGHSTGGDAGRVAEAARVGRLVLTHLPANVPAEQILAEARAAFGGPVELATDLGLIEI
jgi:ribonuclease BN (tRNA processing enzyme)